MSVYRTIGPLVKDLYVVCLYEAQISGERLQDHWSSGLAHLSQRLIGELIVYPCSEVGVVVVIVVVNRFQTSSPPKPLGQSKPFYVEPPWEGETKI